MRFSSRLAFRLAAGTGFAGVGLGAFGAHGLKYFFAHHPGTAELWEKAVFYHLVHAVMLLVVALARPFRATAFLLGLVGIAGFSGSLYLYALSSAYWLVFVTPLGGLCLLGSWFALAWGAGQPRLEDVSPTS